MAFHYNMTLDNGTDVIRVNFSRSDGSDNINLRVTKEINGVDKKIVGINWAVDAGGKAFTTSIETQGIVADPVGSCIAMCVAGKGLPPFVLCLLRDKDPWKCIEKHSIEGWKTVIECVFSCFSGQP